MNEFFIDTKILQIGLVIIIALTVQVFSRNAIERLVRRGVRADRFETKLDEKKREDTVISLFHTSFALIVWVLTSIVILGLLRINVTGLLTGAGIFGVIFGLGAQSIIRNYLSGLFILTENQYRVGDIITVSGGLLGASSATGIVEDITLRITKLRSMDGSIHIIRNGEPGTIENSTFKYSNVIIDITVDYDSDVDKIENVINGVGTDMLTNVELNKMITNPIAFLRVDSFTESGVVIKVMGKVKPGAQWFVAGEFRRQLKVACKKHKIKLGTVAQPPQA